jgi:hypothetical protein
MRRQVCIRGGVPGRGGACREMPRRGVERYARGAGLGGVSSLATCSGRVIRPRSWGWDARRAEYPARGRCACYGAGCEQRHAMRHGLRLLP